MASFGDYAKDFTALPFMNMFHSLLHPEEGIQEAQKQAQQGWNQAQGFETPFMKQGEEQYGPLNQATQALLNPAELQSKWAEGYETSPYARRELEMNKQQGQEAASAMGLMGSSGALSNIQQGAGDIMQKDRQQYMNDLMQKYMTGIGLGQSMYGTGANMAATLGGQAQDQGTTMANLGYAEKAAPGRTLADLLKTGAGAAASYYGNKFNA